MKTILQLLTERPKLLAVFVLAIAFLALAISLHRFISQCLTLVMFLAIAGMFCCPKNLIPVVAYNVSIVLCLATLVCPFDLAIRSSSEWHIGFVRIVRVFQHAGSVERAKQSGLTENVDFVIYEHPASFFGPWWAVLVQIPIQYPIKTPL